MIISSAANQKVVEFVVGRYTELKDARKSKEDIWMECVRAYLSDFSSAWSSKRRKGRSRRYIPLSFDAVETLHSQLTAMTMPGDNWLNLTPAIPGKLEYDDQAAKELETLLRQQLEVMGFERQWDLLVKQLAIVGNAPYTVGWRKDRIADYPAFEAGMQQWQVVHKENWQKYQAEMAKWEQMAKIAAASGQQPPPRPSIVAPEPPSMSGKTKLAYAGPTIEVGDIFNYVVDPFSTDSRHRLCIKRSWISKSVLLRLAEKNRFGYSVYDNVENVVEKEIRAARGQQPLTESYLAFGLQVPEANKVEIHEAWGTMEIPGGSEDGRSTFVGFCATVANRATLIRFEPTFLWSGESPVRLATYRDIPGQVYGVGALEPALGLQDLANVRANQNIDVVSFSVSPEFKAIDDGIIGEVLVSEPGKVHWVGTMDNLEPIHKDLSGLQISMQDLILIKNEYKMVTKSGAPLASDSRESATKTRQDARVIGSDIGKVARHIEVTALKEIIDLFIQLNAQYITKPVAARSLQKGQVSFEMVSPETIRNGWLVKVEGSQYAADKQERVQNLLMFLQLVMGNPMILPAVNMLGFIKKVYEELGFNDADKIFNDEARADQILSEMIKFGLVGNGAGMNGSGVSDADMAISAG